MLFYRFIWNNGDPGPTLLVVGYDFLFSYFLIVPFSLIFYSFRSCNMYSAQEYGDYGELDTARLTVFSKNVGDGYL